MAGEAQGEAWNPHDVRPRAEEFAEHHIALPLFPALTEDPIDPVVSELRDADAA